MAITFSRAETAFLNCPLKLKDTLSQLSRLRECSRASNRSRFRGVNSLFEGYSGGSCSKAEAEKQISRSYPWIISLSCREPHRGTRMRGGAPVRRRSHEPSAQKFSHDYVAWCGHRDRVFFAAPDGYAVARTTSVCGPAGPERFRAARPGRRPCL